MIGAKKYRAGASNVKIIKSLCPPCLDLNGLDRPSLFILTIVVYVYPESQSKYQRKNLPVLKWVV